MFNPNLCQQVSSTRAWTLVSWSIVFVLGHPLLAIALIGAIALLPWLFNRPKWKKRSRLLCVLGVSLYLLIATPLLSGLGGYFLTRNLPADSGQPADAAVALGRGYYQNEIRAQALSDLYQAKRAPVLFPSGRVDAIIMARFLRQQNPNIDKSAIAGEPCSLTTEQNAEFTAAILWPRGVRKIILVTDRDHMRRSQLVFESFGFTVIPHIVPFQGIGATKRSLITIRESVGLVSYGLQGRYQHQDIPPRSVVSGDSKNS